MAPMFTSKRFCLLLAILTATVIPSLCYGHGNLPPQPPTPPIPPVALGGLKRVYPPRWSWLHWWEANRDPYLERIRQGRSGQKPDQKVIKHYRTQAVEALLEATKSDRWQARASAALALGRMAESGALDTLK
ncbi:MAG: HEAT repeat domain-containing protein, partial [Phycisphaerae bacterium]|nr:HEAT repeat domain-containing protein [Phycisphaerae bacterium]